MIYSVFIDAFGNEMAMKKIPHPRLKPQMGDSLIAYSFSSGSPATLVSRLRTPARAAALPTMTQFTSPITAALPMVATAV